ncbi:amidohydrolase family protein [Bremerella sp. P1]|uniref:amidohydrolase family protein n=1 Tax=Bremerella sp. P1 TaxID=3026424 RepID=UPI002367C585|nr:amidohydrolase family protein [Bremerella sp. P1]WDI43318.1 TatD family hydrolase [Bremerella sp. P1]
MIIDCHTHLNNYHEERVRSITECLDHLQEDMSANSVDYALVLSSYKITPHRPATRDVVQATRDFDNIAVVAGISYLHYKERDLREMADFLRDGLVKGLKLYPGYEPFYPHDKRLQVIYDLAIEFDVPVMIHSGDTYSPTGKVRYSHPLHIDDVAVDYPDLKLVICHVGNPWIRDCMEVVYKNENAHADISGLVLGDFEDRFEQFMLQEIREMILYAGEPKYLLYGTDWPICGMKSYLKFIRGLGLPEKSLELIMWQNAARLFKLDVVDGKVVN